MSDEKNENKVLDLMEERMKRKSEQELVEEGYGWFFHPVDDVSEAVGFIDGEYPVSVVICEAEGSGFCMTVDTARKLALEILNALESPHLPKDGKLE